MDPLAAFRNPVFRRLALLAVFVGGLIWLRHLLVLLVFFVAFERLIGWPSDQLAIRTKLNRKVAVLLVLLVETGALAAAMAIGIGRAAREVMSLRHTFPEKIAAFRDTELYMRLREHFGHADGLVEKAQHFVTGTLRHVTEVGHMLAYAVIALVLALIFLLERDELREFRNSIEPQSMQGTLLRWFQYVADAIRVTLGFQVIVAACNAMLTYPVLLALRMHHTIALLFMIFFSGMVPVAGNFVAGAILTLLAYQARGWAGVIVLTILTFVLHKLESYYLNPKLASKHVKLPGFVMIISLIVWEHVVGFVGLFLSFPFLFVATKIRAEFKRDDERLAKAAGQLIDAIK